MGSKSPTASNVFAFYCRQYGLPEPVTEHQFDDGRAAPTKTGQDRAWRFDYAWPDHKIALEVEGGVFMQNRPGRHNSKTGFRKDMEKYNEAARQGWTVARCFPETLLKFETIDLLADLLEESEGLVKLREYIAELNLEKNMTPDYYGALSQVLGYLDEETG